MKIQTARRLSQLFFLLLFVWFCLVSSAGDGRLQVRGWPVNWFLQLDPLVGLATFFSTRYFYRGLVWSLAPVVMTLVLGRFFCGWLCPFGSVQHGLGYLAARLGSFSQRVGDNRYHRFQRTKYYLLAGFLGAAIGENVGKLLILQGSRAMVPILLGSLLTVSFLRNRIPGKKTTTLVPAGTVLLFLGIWALLRWFAPHYAFLQTSVQIGWLDPICLFQRSVNLVLLPVFDTTGRFSSGVRHVTAGAWLIGGLFLAAILLSLKQSRFYCRYLCPLGALFGVLGRFALWRIGKSEDECSQCKRCEAHCEGACNPSGTIRTIECVLCMNCFHVCPEGLIGYRGGSSASGEQLRPDLSRRSALVALTGGALLVPMARLDASLGRGWSPQLIRPPGALAEPEFLDRCIKCGQCMRICPTNVLQPATFQGGPEGVWTPVIVPRTGRSGCQVNCVACGHICPTAAIRPLSLAERHGTGDFLGNGPVRMGTAFIDRGRCLPWAMDRPCIVCQENCPVSPKAIRTRAVFVPQGQGPLQVTAVVVGELYLASERVPLAAVGSGDLYVAWQTAQAEHRMAVTRSEDGRIRFDPEAAGNGSPGVGQSLQIQLRLLRPSIDPGHCIGCGVCEHECPVGGRAAIRVTAENQSRHPRHRFWIG